LVASLGHDEFPHLLARVEFGVVGRQVHDLHLFGQARVADAQVSPDLVVQEHMERPVVARQEVPQSETGSPGDAASTGEPGPQRSPLASTIVDGVETLPPGDPATMRVSFDGTNVHFSFGIPQQAEGTQGPAGEVSTAQLDGAIATTAQNPSGIGPFTGIFSDPPTQAKMEAFAAWSESLRAALVR
jgi:hypothetical protein